MTTTVRATQTASRSSAAPARRPGDEAVRRRPSLRVVDTRRAPRRSLTGLAGTVLAVALFASVFSVVICQVLLVQAQSRLDEVDARIEAEEATDKHLHQDIATLQSPERVVSEARDRLDMVPPPDVARLQPQPGDDERAALDPGTAEAEGTMSNESRAARSGEGASAR
jgi:cell division protein FtsL